MSSPPPPPPPPMVALDGVAHPRPEAAAYMWASPFPRAAPSQPSFSPALLIIAALLLLVVVVSVSIHLFLRFLTRRRHRSRATAPQPQPPSLSSAAAAAAPQTDEKELLISTLPVFTLSSALAKLPKSSPDCAICLTPFSPEAELKLLPACRHAFHAACIDTWLRNTPTCALCRADIAGPGGVGVGESDSFRVEIGSISRRRATSSAGDGVEGIDETAGAHRRSYSVGGSFDYFVDEEVEAVVTRAIPSRRQEKSTEVGAPGDSVAAAAGGGSRGWLRGIATSASSSFNSLRFSERWSVRWGQQRDAAAADAWVYSWDAEGGGAPAREGEAAEHGLVALYRWIVGV